MPEPSCVRARVPSTRWNRSNTRGSSVSGIPTPVSANRQLHQVVALAKLDANATLEGELEGVREEIEHNLLPHLPIDVDRCVDRLAVRPR